MKRVAIIGGGMAGLSAAHALSQATDPVDWQLFEKSGRLGGKVITDHQDGFVIEGGPDSFITQKPWGLELCKQLGLEDELTPCNEAKQKVHILVRGRLCEMPEGFRLTVPTRFWPFIRSPLFTWHGKLRMALEPLIPVKRDDEDESVAAFITRRLGREASDRIGGPLMAGIYVADPARLSILATFPMFRQLEAKYSSLTLAMRAAARRSKGQPKQAMFFSLRGGMGQLIERLAEPLHARCRTGTSLTRLERQKEQFVLTVDNSEQRFDHVILATPLAVTARLLDGLLPAAAESLANIRAVSTATVSLAYRTPIAGLATPLEQQGFGFVVPASEQRSILACTFSSNKFDHRAPADHALLRVFIGGAGHEHRVDQSDEELTALAQQELRDILGITAAPLFSRIYRWPRGNPQYDVGHLARMDAVEAQVATIPGLHLAGSGYRGIGLPDCIRSGQTAARAVLDAATA
jgi:protoporphyrinogen/coproporphyrinogen III oxidase